MVTIVVMAIVVMVDVVVVVVVVMVVVVNQLSPSTAHHINLLLHLSR